MMGSAENDPRKEGTIWALNLDEAAPVIKPLLPVAFSRLTPESVPTLFRDRDSRASDEMMRRLESGRRCYVAKVEGKLAAYGWVSFEEEMVGELNLRLRLVPGEAYIWDCATLPEFRRNLLYSALLTFINKDLHKEGLCRAWIGANLDNVPSQQGIARAGFHHVANLIVARILAMRLVWVEGMPGMPEGVVAEARRVFLGNRDNVWRSALAMAYESELER
jgi:ribosomal protein S18 acetylase RimI-like enzyme